MSYHTNFGYAYAVMWSKTVGLGQDRSETKKIGLGLDLGLVGLVLCCETHHLVTLVLIMILQDTMQQLFKCYL